MAVTASEARKNLFPLIEKVNEDRTPIEITRGEATQSYCPGRTTTLSKKPRTCCASRPTPSAWSKACSRRCPASASSTTSPGEAGFHPARMG